MKTCPHCDAEIRVNELPHPGLLDNYRVCPECDGRFTVDSDTKYRQALFLVVALISLAFTLFLYFDGTSWLFPALVSYAALALLLYWGNRKLMFVPYDKGRSSADKT